jgi:spore germination protein GerM
MRALLAGRMPAERKQGLATAIPDGTELVSFRIVGNTTAIVNLSGLPLDGSPVNRVRVITQVTRTLIGLSGIERVRLRNEGTPWGLWRMTGDIADIAYGYRELLGLTGVGGAGGAFAALP